MQPSSRKEAEISGTTEVENHPCLSGFHFQFVLFTTPSGDIYLLLSDVPSLLPVMRYCDNTPSGSYAAVTVLLHALMPLSHDVYRFPPGVRSYPPEFPPDYQK